jgi:peptide/nickel transport system substrate-binding protein
MPSSLWNASPIELNNTNIEPIGSGPYKIYKLSKQSGGTIDYYDLISFGKFILGKPYIKKITLRFYSSEEKMLEALENGEVDQVSSISPTNAQILKDRNYRIESLTLPRVFGLFFNHNQNQIFINKNIVTAIDLAIDKDNIVRDVLGGYGITIDGPIPPNMVNDINSEKSTETAYEEKVKKAEEILAKDGWKKGEDGYLQKTTTEKKVKKTAYLEFSISTSNAQELTKAALSIKQDLEKIGMKIEVKTFEIGNLNQGVIRPRKYDALLFGQIINSKSDLFAFWHSSQRNDPGLNVAMYTNAKVDKILEETFVTLNENERIKKYSQFTEEIKKDMPAVFLYSPDLIYVLSKNVEGFDMDHITTPGERFLNSYLWYTQMDNVWKIFSK